MYQAILFDLDGTLTDSGPGITRCVSYALEKMGKPCQDLQALRCFVGPPLKDMFMEFSGMNEEEAIKAIQFYRERYVPIGIYENSLYPGIPEMLEDLLAKGYRLAIASSKPEKFVTTVLDYFQIEDYFQVIVGSMEAQNRNTKAQSIQEALRRLGLEDHPEAVVMVGDTRYDVQGAREMGIDCLAVSYGYDTPEGLADSRPLATVSAPSEVTDFFT